MHSIAQKTKTKQQNTPSAAATSRQKNAETNAPVHQEKALLSSAISPSFQANPADAGSNTAATFPHSFSHSFSRLSSQGMLQTKLRVNQAGDRYEQEANQISQQVMRSPEPSLQRSCSGNYSCSKCQSKTASTTHPQIQTKQNAPSDAGQATAPPIVNEVLAQPGQSLAPSARHFLEPRFGQNFDQVQVHTGSKATESARQINARAYTVGQNVVFGAGEYQPNTSSGLGLLAHELVHVLQQNGPGGTPEPMVQRQGIGEPPMQDFQDIPDIRDPETTSAPKGKDWAGSPSHCPKTFCKAYPTQRFAEDDRKTFWPFILAGITLKVSSRVSSLWTTWAFGGSRLQNLTKSFGGDFTSSKTTAKTTKFLKDKITAKLTASPPAIGPSGFASLDIPTLIPTAVSDINTEGNAKEMNFNVIGEIPGNIAGGIGANQASIPIGAMPSSQNDARIAHGTVSVFDFGGSDLWVVPSLQYTVKDTIDFCPGNCGSKKEQKVTLTMSRWEATGISGDVPFTVDFPGHIFPYAIPKPKAAAPAAPAGPAPAPAPASVPAPVKPLP